MHVQEHARALAYLAALVRNGSLKSEENILHYLAPQGVAATVDLAIQFPPDMDMACFHLSRQMLIHWRTEATTIISHISQFDNDARRGRRSPDDILRPVRHVPDVTLWICMLAALIERMPMHINRFDQIFCARSLNLVPEEASGLHEETATALRHLGLVIQEYRPASVSVDFRRLLTLKSNLELGDVTSETFRKLFSDYDPLSLG